MTTTGSARLLASDDDDDDEEDQAFAHSANEGKAPALQSGWESESEDEISHQELGQVDKEELAALKREAEEQQSGLEGQELGRGKRQRKENPHQQHVQRSEPAHNTQAAQAAWAAFQDKDDASIAGSDSKEMVRVIERYNFAGDEVVQERLLLADHPDAIAYLKRLRSTGEHAKHGNQASSARQAEPASISKPEESEPYPALAATARQPSTCSTSSSVSPAPRPPPPGPRRKKQSKLATLAAPLDQPKKMNTLEKSKMDWESWKQGTVPSKGAPSGVGTVASTISRGQDGLSEREREEMEQQTKTGSGTGTMAGYLGRSDFLERVKERTEGE